MYWVLKTHTYVPHNSKHSLGGWTRKLRPISQLNTADRINCFVYFPAKNLLKRKKKVAKENCQKGKRTVFSSCLTTEKAKNKAAKKSKKVLRRRSKNASKKALIKVQIKIFEVDISDKISCHKEGPLFWKRNEPYFHVNYASKIEFHINLNYT